VRIIISNSSPEPIYEQIARQIKAEIFAGALEEGAALPSIRALAHDLQVSVITTKRAYDELEREGFLDSVGGKGTFVAAQNPAFIREKRMKLVEEKLAAAVAEARVLGVGLDELNETLRLLFMEER
jgi:GntR family transcriptional regulator